MMTNWYFHIDDGLTNAFLFIDLKKAFNTTDHEILLSKLELYGFKGASLNLFRDYLSDRTRVTVINNVNSETSNNNNVFISYIKYTNITPPANSKGQSREKLR